MKKIIIFILSSIFMCKFAFANTNDQSFAIYVTNNTPYAINLLNSNYNKTPINYIANSVTSGVQQLKVATVKMDNGMFDISFFAHPGNEEMSYNNSALVTYFLNPHALSMQFEPATLTVDGKNYSVSVLFAKGIDQNTNSILLTIQ